MTDKTDLAFNCETSDPDDMLTLCMLATHPRVNLVAVVITPGSRSQVAVVKHLLERLECSHIPVGSRNPDHPKQCVSGFHYDWLSISKDAVAEPDGLGEDILHAAATPNWKIISGAPLSCIARYLDKYQTIIPEVVMQGGFAGDSVVPEEHRLAKFVGRETCPTFNLNGDILAACVVIDTPLIQLKRFVSKNVCHGVIYNQEMHERIKPHRTNNAGLDLMVGGMKTYLAKHPKGKAFHDPLAACVAIDPKICTWAEVEIYREKGEWGSRLIERNGLGPDTFISVAMDREKFEQALTGRSTGPAMRERLLRGY